MADANTAHENPLMKVMSLFPLFRFTRITRQTAPANAPKIKKTTKNSATEKGKIPHSLEPIPEKIGYTLKQSQSENPMLLRLNASIIKDTRARLIPVIQTDLRIFFKSESFIFPPVIFSAPNLLGMLDAEATYFTFI